MAIIYLIFFNKCLENKGYYYGVSNDLSDVYEEHKRRCYDEKSRGYNRRLYKEIRRVVKDRKHYDSLVFIRIIEKDVTEYINEIRDSYIDLYDEDCLNDRYYSPYLNK
jgi:hypothetical protein